MFQYILARKEFMDTFLYDLVIAFFPLKLTASFILYILKSIFPTDSDSTYFPALVISTMILCFCWKILAFLYFYLTAYNGKIVKQII